MKDIMNKLADLEATAPKKSGKKMLNEDSTTPPMNVSDKPASLKDMFESIAGMKPVPVVGKEGDSQQTGAGFVNIVGTDPASQALGKAVGDLAAQKKLQIVVPNQPGQSNPAAGQPAPAGATGQQPAGQMQMKEKWDAETKVAPSEKGKYEGKSKAELTKAYNKLKASGPHKKGSPEFGKMRELAFAIRAKSGWGKVQEEQLDELSPETLQSYQDKNKLRRKDSQAGGSPEAAKTIANRTTGWARSQDKLHGGAKVPANEGAKVDRMVKHIEKSERKLGKSKDEAENIAWATANKRGMLDNKNKKKVKEGDIAPTNGIDTKGAGLGAGRSQTTLEAKEPQVEVIDNAFNRENYKDLIGKKYPKSKAPAYARVKEISEGAKPDFLDLDKDGNKKEPMKKAAADKKKQKVKESMNHRISAARLEGKSHGLRGHAHSGKRYEDLEELKAYHEGYKEGLDECYGQGVYEAAPAMPPATVGGMAKAAMEAEMEEGNAFTAALARTPKGGKFSVGGKTFTDRSSHDAKIDEYAFESKDLDEAVFNPMGGIARGLRGVKDIVKDTPHAQLPGVMGAGAGAAVGIPAAATAGAVGAAFLPIIGASALGGYGLLKAGQLTGKVLNFLAQKLFGTKEEALAFAKAHLEAAKAGENSFEHNGKTYKVSLKPGQISQLYGDIEDLTRQVKNKEFDKRMAPDTTMGKIGAALKEDPVFESWDNQLKSLVNEGLSVSVSKGQQNSPDSVTITAQDAEADQLLQLVKSAGLGLFGGDEHHEPSSAMSLQPASGEPDEVGAGGVDIDVVDGSDGMLSLMKKLSGVQDAGAEDYADEEGDHEEHTCNECGMMETQCGCSHGKDKVEEVESEDQMTDEVAEANAPDSGAQDSVADEDAEAREDSALAGADSKDEEEVNESFFDLLGRLSKLAESKEEDEEDVTESKDEEEDEGDDFFHNKKVAKDKQLPNPPKEIKIDEWANQAGKGPGKGTDASFEQDIDFMTKVIAGGLNKPKSTGQTTIPVIAGQEDRMHDSPKDWATLAGIKK